MTELLTAAQMKAIEAAAIASGEVTGLELMERAGRGVVEAIFEEWPELQATSHRAVVLCGPGNNGGDGFVVARLLKEWGWEVEVFLYGTPEGMPPDARGNYERWARIGEVRGLIEAAGNLTARPDVIVDALFGIGLSRPLSDALSKALDLIDFQCPESTVWHVAVDIPSGICAQSGGFLTKSEPERDYLAGKTRWRSDLTATFHRPKLGHVLGDGPENCGTLVVVDIGLVSTCGVPLVRASAELPKLMGHKYEYGHSLVVSGGIGHGGAARLAARGALRIGAGLVTLACPPDALPENATRLDAIMLKTVTDGVGLAEVLHDERINALCLGPGMGTGTREAGLVAVVLGGPPPPSPPHKGEGGRVGQGAAQVSQSLPLPLGGRGEGWGARSVVLDADALTLIAQDADLFSMLHSNCILTPHGGEFARLFPHIAAKLDAPATMGPAYSKVDATREAAARAGCVVLFKGPDTVIADPSGRCAINSAAYDRAAPWLATAGSGDVLAGFITGLLARGFSPFDAACTGAWLHVECARSFGPGLIAEDLPEELPKVFRALSL